MRAMILSAGLGQRMQPLTLQTPKPLLAVAGKPLIVHHINNFLRAGIRDIVINLGHLGEMIENTLGDGSAFGVNIQYSYEDPILEVGGGINKALSLLGAEPFIAVSGDVFTEFPFQNLPPSPKGLVHIVLTDNPPHHPKGDFALQGEEVFEKTKKPGVPLLNFAGIGVYRPELFQGCPKGAFGYLELLKKAFLSRTITGEYYRGIWYNIGTPEDLEMVNKLMANRAKDVEQS